MVEIQLLLRPLLILLLPLTTFISAIYISDIAPPTATASATNITSTTITTTTIIIIIIIIIIMYI